MNSNDLSALDAAVLTQRLAELLRSERGCQIDFLRHLAELERREVHLALGFSSLFVYCTEHLRLSRGATFRRTHAARLLTKFPAVADYLADGRLNLTTLVALRDVLTPENHGEVLESASGLTEDEVDVLVAKLQPRPDVRESVRRLPARAPELNLEGTAASRPTPPPSPVAARIEPLREDRFGIHLSVSGAFREDLKAVTAALSHVAPEGRLEDVLHECIRIALKEVRRRKVGGDKPRAPAKPARRFGPNQNPENPTRYVEVAVRREVWNRDDGKCAFVSADGRRCNSTHQVELHHIEPYALGGPPTAENLSLRCKRHNRYHALQDFGAEKMKQFERVR